MSKFSFRSNSWAEPVWTWNVSHYLNIRRPTILLLCQSHDHGQSPQTWQNTGAGWECPMSGAGDRWVVLEKLFWRDTNCINFIVWLACNASITTIFLHSISLPPIISRPYLPFCIAFLKQLETNITTALLWWIGENVVNEFRGLVSLNEKLP